MKELNNFLKTCLDGADLAECSDSINNDFLKELGLGIYSYAIRMRNGVKEVIDLVEDRRRLTSRVEYLENVIKDFDEIIAIDDVDFLTDENKKQIRELVIKLVEENIDEEE